MIKRVILILMPLAGIICGLLWWDYSGYLDESRLRISANNLALDVAKILSDKDYDSFIKTLDSFGTNEYEALSEEEREEIKEMFNEASDILNESFGSGWAKKTKRTDFNAMIVNAPGRTAYEGNITVFVKSSDWDSFMIEFVEENGNLYLSNGIFLLERLCNQ